MSGEEILGETAGVRIKKLLDPRVARGFEKESGVMKLGEGD